MPKDFIPKLHLNSSQQPETHDDVSKHVTETTSKTSAQYFSVNVKPHYMHKRPVPAPLKRTKLSKTQKFQIYDHLICQSYNRNDKIMVNIKHRKIGITPQRELY